MCFPTKCCREHHIHGKSRFQTFSVTSKKARENYREQLPSFFMLDAKGFPPNTTQKKKVFP